MDKKIVYRPDLAEAAEHCPLCGAPVAVEEEPEPEVPAQQPEQTPRTVAELLALCDSFETDPAAHRFYIGKDEKDATGYGLFVDEFGDMPQMRAESCGSGMGSKDFERPNCVKTTLGEPV